MRGNIGAVLLCGVLVLTGCGKKESAEDSNTSKSVSMTSTVSESMSSDLSATVKESAPQEKVLKHETAKKSAVAPTAKKEDVSVEVTKTEIAVPTEEEEEPATAPVIEEEETVVFSAKPAMSVTEKVIGEKDEAVAEKPVSSVIHSTVEIVDLAEEQGDVPYYYAVPLGNDTWFFMNEADAVDWAEAKRSDFSEGNFMDQHKYVGYECDNCAEYNGVIGYRIHFYR